ncbi:MAG: ABC transporter permease [Thermoprotei archaeon]|nr:MAG: ABC transporter permease [Thermoprotei archaeon]
MSKGAKLKSFLYEHIYIPLRILAKSKTSLVGLIIVSVYVVMAIVGPMIVPLDLTPHREKRFMPPSLEHPLGTDFAGRDIFAQIVHGGPPVLRVAFLAAFFTVLLGTVIGIASGYIGGKVDLVLMSFTDIFLTIPGFPLLMIIAVWLMQSRLPVTEPIVALLLSITSWAGLARAIRSQVLAIKKEPYIEVVKCLGLGRFHVIFKEILPNMMPYIAINFMLSSIGAIYAYTGLLALGLLPYSPGNWGAMIHMAQAYTGTIGTGWWYVLAPSMAIIILQIGLVFLSSGIDKIFNPRLREE